MSSTDQIEEEKKTDISESWLLEKYPAAFRKLLIDHSRPKDADGNRHYIIWATDSYSHLGQGYGVNDEITPERIVGDHGNIIQPRASKSKEEQSKRVKDKAEVFTPSWICNAQNNLIDEAWFGRPDVFNREVTLEDGSHSWIPTEGKIEFSDEKGKTWRDYVKDVRLEITCGEAPYLVSRYDTVTGERIDDLNRRIGILDRKLRVVGENAHTPDLWRKWAKLALEATYGYDWLGDNLVLAREALLISVFEYHRAKFGKEISRNSVEGLAYRISWNIWQMDGLKYVIPGSCDWPECKKRRDDGQLGEMFIEFVDKSAPSECPACKTGKGEHRGYPAKIRDWKAYNDSRRKKDEYKINIEFTRLLNNDKKG